MAKSKRYRVTLHRASKGERGIVRVHFTIGGAPDPSREIVAAGLPDVLAQADAFAAEHGKACSVYVRCLDAPKPPGFDKATRSLFRNMDKAEVE